MGFDETEQTQWLVTDTAADEEYDSLWADDANWEMVDEVDTFSGNKVQRKCLHMWGQRLCLCQFLGWMDSRKFQCQAKGSTFYTPELEGPAMVSQRSIDRLKPNNAKTTRKEQRKEHEALKKKKAALKKVLKKEEKAQAAEFKEEEKYERKEEKKALTKAK